MRKTPQHTNGLNPLQRLSQKGKALQLLVGTAVIGLVVSAVMIYMNRTQENEFGFPVANEMEQLLEMATLEDKFCLVKFDAPYCFPCTHDNPSEGKTFFKSVSDQYVMYQLNALDLNGEGPLLTRHYAVTTLPTWLVLNADGEEVFRWETSTIPPIETLGQLEALRDVPVSATNRYEPVEGDHAEPERNDMFTLNWQGGLSYWEAIRKAEQLEPLVLESVWTQPDSSGSWSVCSGTYHGMIEARESRLFHTEWREHPLQIVPLKESGWQLPSY